LRGSIASELEKLILAQRSKTPDAIICRSKKAKRRGEIPRRQQA
jgi:hypothetical protein